MMCLHDHLSFNEDAAHIIMEYEGKRGKANFQLQKIWLNGSSFVCYFAMVKL